jgi:hypothetical protein
MTMPSGTVVTTGYDGLGRPNTLSGKVGSNTTSYVTSVSYAPHGAVQQVALGNGLTEQSCFNNMLQPFVIRQRRTGASSCLTGTAADGNDVGYLYFTFPSGNNGNVAGQAIQYAASGSHGAHDVPAELWLRWRESAVERDGDWDRSSLVAIVRVRCGGKPVAERGHGD